ncbi:dihydrolipoamide acetyltransferase component of pyruvate dehydrogenase complex [Actinocatenispora thailandica]|uniref:Dihydrolipoamide acetyltransferase component of pyruvate dehydrogenase complex n=1 Tax=Actinocatenispora thailandica TaxID=227318 RepID=A0A7R7HYH7_9ACTN|nr:2-oxoglutarate dehydrogenase, E2 component, dihydrolipoamide succinyltransferase [Actinocatenispora thailandica]BCJ36244.1 dihydrolipoamide acetyltransferase component of pyruvate dehydrogenase complex [Actinocatenispora thailandica]
MPTSVTMPQLGESVTEGTVTRWLKQEGDRVEVDEPLLEVSTDKVDTEIPSPAAGVLSRIVVPEDETVDVGAELAQISGDGESAPTQQAAEPPQPPASQQSEPAQPEPAQSEPAQSEPAPQAPAQPAAPPAQPEPAAEAPAPSGGAAEGTEVAMPALGESVTEGTVTRWLKQVGESVEVDEPLLEVSTDKVDTEIPSPAAGTVLDIKVQQDQTVDVGTVLAIVGSGAPAAAPSRPGQPAPAPTPAPTPPAPTPAPAPERPAAPIAQPVQQTAPAAAPQVERPAPTQQAGGDGPSGYVTPLVRKLAAEHGIDLGSLTGTGVGGRIRKQDVLDAAEAKKQAAAKPAAPAPAPAAAAPTAAPSPLRGRTEKLPRMRQVIAKRMVESLQTAAQLTTVIEVDVTRIAQLRARAKNEFAARHGVKLSFLPFFALAAVEALREHPKLNASIDTEQKTVTYHDTENLAIAVDTDRGLIVPVIHNAGDLNLAGLARHIADLAERTRDNKVSPDDLAGGTFTLTNTGSVGVLFDTPIFPQPQVAMLGTGAVVKRAVVVDDENLGEIIVPRSMVYLALSYDHRLVDGADAARYLATVKERLEAGDFESSLGL